MAISIDDIKKLRAMTGAGLADVKKALTEAEAEEAKPKRASRRARKDEAPAAEEAAPVAEEAAPAEAPAAE